MWTERYVEFLLCKTTSQYGGEFKAKLSPKCNLGFFFD